MPRQRTHHSRRTYVVPADFPQRLRRFQEESALSWSDIAPPPGYLSPHRMALVHGRGKAQPTSHESASGPGRLLWPQLSIHRIGNGAPARGYELFRGLRDDLHDGRKGEVGTPAEAGHTNTYLGMAKSVSIDTHSNSAMTPV